MAGAQGTFIQVWIGDKDRPGQVDLVAFLLDVADVARLGPGGAEHDAFEAAAARRGGLTDSVEWRLSAILARTERDSQALRGILADVGLIDRHRQGA